METENITQPLTQRVIQMMDKKGFCNLFWSDWKSGRFKTHESVYESLEIEYQSVFFRRRYASFKSFLVRRDE